MAVTIRDIARLSNTSIAAVSRVLNNRGGVNPDKQKRILQLAHELEYTPNRSARNLATNRSQLIGVIVSDLSISNYIDFIHHVENLSRVQGYQTLIADSKRDLNIEIANVATMLEHRADGILIFPVAEFGAVQHVDHFLSLRLKKVPFVLHGSTQRGAFDAVCMDEEKVGYDIGRYFTHLGHRRLAIAGCASPTETILDRQAGYARAATEAGAQVVDDRAVAGLSELHCTPEYLAYWQEILSAPERPTALFVINDEKALVLYRAFHEWGIRIPEDLSIASIDNRLFTPFLTPALASADPNIIDRAQEGMRILFERIQNPEAIPIISEMYYTFIPRESIAPPQEKSRKLESIGSPQSIQSM